MSEPERNGRPHGQNAGLLFKIPLVEGKGRANIHVLDWTQVQNDPWIKKASCHIAMKMSMIVQSGDL
ncbi:hypothetical protein WDW86_18735 [Bdellovibrionota bacterium FG-2]